MVILKKAAPVAAALMLGARALFGNPLESTVIKEDGTGFEFTGSFDTNSLSLNSSLPAVDGWEIDFASDTEYDNGKDVPPRINNLDLAVGNPHFFIGASYGDLSSDTLLERSNIMKVQTGIRLWDWFDASATGAKVSIPQMKTYVASHDLLTFEFPVDLYALGWNVDIGKEFNLGNVGLFPWLSVVGSAYWAEAKQNQDLIDLASALPDYAPNSIAYPFDHLNLRGGLDVKTRLIDFMYQGEFEGQFYSPSPFNFTNSFGIKLHDEERRKLELNSSISLITLPQRYTHLTNPTRNELKFDAGGFYFFPGDFFVKGQASALVDFLSPAQFSATVGIGKKFNGGNFELYFNLQSNTAGLLYSTNFDKSSERESRKKGFTELAPPSPDLNSSLTPVNLAGLHAQFGNTLEDLVAYVKAHGRQGISDAVQSMPYVDTLGDISARIEWEVNGYGDCGDTNGNLISYLETHALGNEAWGVSLTGSYLNHGLTVVKDRKTGKFGVWDFQRYYNLKATNWREAMQEVYPGAYIYGDGTVTLPIETVRDAVERPLYDWRKFK